MRLNLYHSIFLLCLLGFVACKKKDEVIQPVIEAVEIITPQVLINGIPVIFPESKGEVEEQLVMIPAQDILTKLGFTCTLEKLVKLKLIGAKFAEIPFLHRYDQKQSDSKMVSSVTTLGYLVMTILYHWPWGGWRSSISKKHLSWRKSNDLIN